MAGSDHIGTPPHASADQAKRLEAALERADERCRNLESQLRKSQRMHVLGTLASGMAHDFNNLLTVIAGNTELVLSEGPSAAARESLDEIRNAYLRGKDLVRRLLLFSRREESEKRPVNLSEIVEDAVRLLRGTISRSIKVTVRYAPDLPLISADPTAIHQVIMNLGTNAAHAMGRDGGRLTIKIDCVRIGEGAVHAPGLVPGSYVRLAVRDRGAGISPDIMDQIFDPFFTTKGEEGTGLGLAVVNGIMREHNGAVTVTSEPGHGTTFCLFFPEAIPARDDAAAAAAPVRGNGQRIMYLDDEATLARLMSRMLDSLGYRCSAFTDVGRALEELRASPRAFDAVVADLSKPGLSGAALARALTDIRAGIPIAIISHDPHDAAPPAAGQIRLHLKKPVPMADLSFALRRLTGHDEG